LFAVESPQVPNIMIFRMIPRVKPIAGQVDLTCAFHSNLGFTREWWRALGLIRPTGLTKYSSTTYQLTVRLCGSQR